jgi:hypothetical protein
MGASTVFLNGKTEPETLEALACREAVALAWDINARRMYAASDCLTVVRNIKAGTLGVYAQVISEIKMAMEAFDLLSFGHEKRASNKEAHCTARSVVLHDPGRRLWLVNPPEGLCIPEFVQV